MSNKTYVGNGKQREGIDIINISICLNDIPKEEITTSESNGKKYVRLSVGTKRDVDQYGNTHSVWINDWKPSADGAAPAPAPARKSLEQEEDLPF